MRQQHDRRADTHFPGTLRDRAGDNLRRGTDIAAEVMLADPDRIEAQLFRVSNLVEEVLVVLLLGAFLSVLIEECQQTEFHRAPPALRSRLDLAPAPGHVRHGSSSSRDSARPVAQFFEQLLSFPSITRYPLSRAR